MFEAETKALFAKYFQTDKSQFFQCNVQLNVQLYFGFCYKLPNFLEIIDEYCIWLSSDLTV